ncbi:hypothetical protein GCM10017711_41120 [Paeniglutamicibacter sulfureus]
MFRKPRPVKRPVTGRETEHQHTPDLPSGQRGNRCRARTRLFDHGFQLPMRMVPERAGTR